MFQREKQAILRVFKRPRPTFRESMLLAAVYAAEAILCTALLSFGYHAARAHEVGWAIISAIIVLQPGLEDSLATSIARILANVVGAAVAFLVVRFLGDGTGQLLIAIAIIVLVCELTQLDMALRTACVTAVIVMLFSNGKFAATTVERPAAVMIGSVVAVVVQLLAERLKEILLGRRALSAPAQAAPAHPKPEQPLIAP
jgi:uncharacterized membrane protein YccC